MIQILAVSGSLRAASSNTAALIALQRLAPPGVAMTLYEGLRGLPAFEPDQDGAILPRRVLALKAAFAGADAVVISSPEYARGIAGSLKNALDWLVSGPEMPGKRIALLNTSPRAVDALAALRLTLHTMSAVIVDAACITLPLLGRTLDADAIAADPALSTLLCQALDVLVASPSAPTAPGSASANR